MYALKQRRTNNSKKDICWHKTIWGIRPPTYPCGGSTGMKGLHWRLVATVAASLLPADAVFDLVDLSSKGVFRFSDTMVGLWMFIYFTSLSAESCEFLFISVLRELVHVCCLKGRVGFRINLFLNNAIPNNGSAKPSSCQQPLLWKVVASLCSPV